MCWMNKLPVISASAFLDYLKNYGCVVVSSRGSHFKVENPKNGKRAPIPVHGSRDIDRAFLKDILIQLGIDIDEFISFIH